MFGHLNFRSLTQLVDKELILGVTKLNVLEKVCDVCLIGKQSKNAFSSNTAHRSTEILNVIYSDVYGPLEVCSLGGNNYPRC